jgi:hypothetical protein
VTTDRYKPVLRTGAFRARASVRESVLCSIAGTIALSFQAN